jgi:hypothetical protein
MLDFNALRWNLKNYGNNYEMMPANTYTYMKLGAKLGRCEEISKYVHKKNIWSCEQILADRCKQLFYVQVFAVVPGTTPGK